MFSESKCGEGICLLKYQAAKPEWQWNAIIKSCGWCCICIWIPHKSEFHQSAMRSYNAFGDLRLRASTVTLHCSLSLLYARAYFWIYDISRTHISKYAQFFSLVHISSLLRGLFFEQTSPSNFSGSVLLLHHHSTLSFEVINRVTFSILSSL